MTDATTWTVTCANIRSGLPPSLTVPGQSLHWNYVENLMAPGDYGGQGHPVDVSLRPAMSNGLQEAH